MKKLFILGGLATFLLGGCTKDFNEINTNPTATSGDKFNPNFLLPNIQADAAGAVSGYNGPILFQSGWVQILASTSSGGANYYSNADKYVESSNTLTYVASTWSAGYRAASQAYEMYNLSLDKPQYSNLSNIAVIMKVLAMSKVTDTYGDAPYSQALQAKTGVTLPVYDNQQSIYTSMLKELETATAALDVTKDKAISDQYYKGDIAQWKKFGYSLMLQLAMRLTKADAATAKAWAEKAYAGGVFSSSADDAVIKFEEASGYSNGNLNPLFVEDDLYEVRWSKTFIDKLKATNDPRLGVIAEVPNDGLANNKKLDAGNKDAAVQMGLPNGYDMNGGATDITKAPDYPGGTGTGADLTKIGKYSRPAGFYRNRSGAFFVLTYGETELLLAEAAARGWSVGASAATHYMNGVMGGLKSLSAFGASATISDATAMAYATANPLDVSSQTASLKQINEQIWLTTGAEMNYSEAWNNWRRSGYPVLTPVNYASNFSGGTIPRRQLYPGSEGSLNAANFSAAVSALSGGDKWTSRVWWDK